MAAPEAARGAIVPAAHAPHLAQSRRMDDFYRFGDMDQTFTILIVV